MKTKLYLTQENITSLQKKRNLWKRVKKSALFDVTIGAFDGAVVCWLVGIYMLKIISQKYSNKNSDLNRDDSLQLHSTKPELRFCVGSKPARGVWEIRDREDLWQWFRLEIRLNAFRRSTIPQKQFIIIIIIIITIIFRTSNYLHIEK